MARAKDPELICGFQVDGSVDFGARYRSGLQLTGRLRPIRDRLLMVELTVHSGREIDSDMLRAIRPRELADLVRAEALRRWQTRPEQIDNAETVTILQRDSEVQHALRGLRRTARAAARGTEPRQRTRGDAFYRTLALAYVDLTQRGLAGQGVYERLAEAIGEPFGADRVGDAQRMRDWLQEAQRRGFYTSLGKGRSGARPGDRLFDPNEGEA